MSTNDRSQPHPRHVCPGSVRSRNRREDRQPAGQRRCAQATSRWDSISPRPLQGHFFSAAAQPPPTLPRQTSFARPAARAAPPHDPRSAGPPRPPSGNGLRRADSPSAHISAMGRPIVPSRLASRSASRGAWYFWPIPGPDPRRGVIGVVCHAIPPHSLSRRPAISRCASDRNRPAATCGNGGVGVSRGS